MNPNLKLKGRNYGDLHPDSTAGIVTVLESFAKKDQEDLEWTYGINPKKKQFQNWLFF